MCVAFFALEHPDYALILCSNRDEHLARPTRPAAFHAFGAPRPPHVLSGIDVQGGGTWLGLNRTGKLALLTNITEQHGTYAASRGSLLSSFLSAPCSPHSLEADVRGHVPSDARFAGFNLVVFAPARPTPRLALDALYVTNHGGGGPIAYRPLSDAQRHHGALSNGIDGAGADTWPKVQHGLDVFAHLVDTLAPNTPEDVLAEDLLDLLTWRSSQPPRDRSELKHTIQVDPLHIGREGYDGLYATRLSTVVLVKRTGHVLFIERDRWALAATPPEPQEEQAWGPDLADPGSQRVFRFELEVTNNGNDDKVLT